MCQRLNFGLYTYVYKHKESTGRVIGVIWPLHYHLFKSGHQNTPNNWMIFPYNSYILDWYLHSHKINKLNIPEYSNIQLNNWYFHWFSKFTVIYLCMLVLQCGISILMWFLSYIVRLVAFKLISRVNYSLLRHPLIDKISCIIAWHSSLQTNI